MVGFCSQWSQPKFHQWLQWERNQANPENFCKCHPTWIGPALNDPLRRPIKPVTCALLALHYPGFSWRSGEAFKVSFALLGLTYKPPLSFPLGASSALQRSSLQTDNPFRRSCHEPVQSAATAPQSVPRHNKPQTVHHSSQIINPHTIFFLNVVTEFGKDETETKLTGPNSFPV